MGKRFSEVERAYLAGLLDGDGAIMATIERHAEKRFGYRVRVMVKITQRSRDVLDWIHQALGIGYIRTGNSFFEWEVRDQTQVSDLLNLISPHLKVKDQQAKYALQIVKIHPRRPDDLRRKAHLADALARLNVRSKDRRKNFASMIQVNLSRND